MILRWRRRVSGEQLTGQVFLAIVRRTMGIGGID
jgi:hypothetical protein